MDTMVIERGQSSFLVSAAHVVRTQDDLSAELASNTGDTWDVDKSNPFITWIAGDFVEGDNPNSNKQFWTAGDLELAEYSIKYAPLNMIHKQKQPVGFYAATKNVKLERPKEAAEALKLSKPVEPTGSMKIQALSGMWSHLFPFEAAQVDLANDEGLLFYSMECRGTHLTCAGDEGCGQTFDYMQPATHCEHLLERSSIRHIVNPTFRGGALIVPPVRPGWKNASASVLTDAVMADAASYAEQTQEAFEQLRGEGRDISSSTWEQTMAMLVQHMSVR